jgi:hypothetical protein
MGDYVNISESGHSFIANIAEDQTWDRTRKEEGQ